MRIPRHIGIIPDGNRRWAKDKSMDKSDGYQHGLNPGLEVLKEAMRYGVEEVTYYGFTVDNCRRPKEQIKAFQQACTDAVKLIENEAVSLLVVGNTDSKFFPEELLPYTKRNIEEDSSKMKVNFLVNYGWDWDLRNGFCSKAISRIDMIIRWGGMCRLSGFLPVQSVYADFYVVNDLWPDYKNEHFEEAIKWYQKQDVTLGG
ncbi:undecaprenyl diphosphate synthase [Anaerosporobacter mobilis DSM 15930]|uniref:Undecaprenyl diphosphate synthase n=1 Tax=Anaerosporobacter mobilis DSM 15930 TaxID=1120996 RepID=A0A1M7M1I8_9FIRM|nr:undecaprenyl diphosphate synthase family protein [Anaerosporobacter mobilis]SHM84533.1 undecaprenyl diphosphate synthase [Anaerosporobacter mobilis DSM 15930]